MKKELDQKILKIFLVSLQESFRVQVNMKLEIREIREEKVVFKNELTGAMIVFSGKTYEGKIRVVFTKSFLKLLCKSMLGDTIGLNGSDHISAALEMVNVIYASARVKINALGHKFDLSLPSELIRNNANEIESWDPSVKIDCKTQIGNFTTEIWLEKKVSE